MICFFYVKIFSLLFSIYFYCEIRSNKEALFTADDCSSARVSLQYVSITKSSTLPKLNVRRLFKINYIIVLNSYGNFCKLTKPILPQATFFDLLHVLLFCLAKLLTELRLGKTRYNFEHMRKTLKCIMVMELLSSIFLLMLRLLELAGLLPTLSF